MELKTWTGSLAPLDKNVGEVKSFDIVMHMGRERRFGNAGDPEYSIMHHTFLGVFIWLRLGYPIEELVHWILHDCHEYVTGDMPTPLKRLINELAGKEVTKLVEKRIDNRIYEHYGVPAPSAKVKERVKHVDRVAAVMESLIIGPVGCDLSTVIADEERAEMQKTLEQVEPGFNAMVRRRQ